MKENQNGVLCDLNNRENDANLLESEKNNKDGARNTEEIMRNMGVKDISNGNEREKEFIKLFEERNLCADKDGSENDNKPRDYVAPCTISSGENEFCDKNIDIFPELIVCYEENPHHVVKDICIDEGVPFEDKILMQSDIDEKGDVTIESEDIEFLSAGGSKSLSETDSNEDEASDYGAKEKAPIELLLADALQSLLENDFDHDISTGGGSLALESEETNYNETEKIMDEVSREKFATSSVPSLEKFGNYQSLQSLLKSPEFDGNQIEKNINQILSSEAKIESPVAVSAAEESDKNSPVDVLSYNSNVEIATITFDFNSLKSAAIGREDNCDDANREQPFKIDIVSDSFAIGSESQRGHGESSFSMAGPASGLITFSGPIASSGSVSLRSDSSATSTRSFAFPLLQSEWNSSPVRMAKADRRHYRKHRGWRQCLLCCRF